MATVMRALLVLSLLLLGAPAHAEPVTAFLTWVGSAVGAGAASAYAVGAFIVTTAFSLGTQAYANNQQKKRAHQEAARKLAQDIANLSDRRVTLLQSDSPNAVVYGSPGRIGGSIVAMLSSGTGDQLTHLVIIFAAHPCEGIDEIYIDDDPVQAGEDGWTTNEALKRAPSGVYDFDNGPMVHIGIHLSPGGVDTADQWLIDQLESPVGGFPGAGLWTADHKLSGYTYAVVTVNKVMSRFQGGPPNITARVRGKSTVYDPRTGTRGYTRNPALCLADFIMSTEGYGASLDQIDTAAWIAAANACDQDVYGPEADADAENYGNSRALYVCDGMFRSDQNRDSTRQQIEEAMAGFSLQSAGVWRLQAGAWSTPVLALTEHDMLAPITVVQTCHPGERVYNTARGTYINAARNGVSEDFTAYQNAVFVGLDPHVKATDMALAFTASHVRCHQLARVAVERSRGGLVLQIHPKMLAWHLQPGDRVLLTSAFYGFADKAFIVTDWSYSRNAPLTLEVLEDVPAFYDTADEVLADAAPNTNLPNPFEQPEAPQNLQVESGVDNLAVQGGSVQVRARVSWSRSGSAYVLNGGTTRVQWRLGVTDLEQPEPPDVDPWKTVDLPGDAVETFVLGLDVGAEYTVRAQFRTEFAESAWSWAGHLITGNTPPAEVDGLSLTVEPDGIMARWSPPEGIDLIEWDRTLVGRGDTVDEAGGDIRFNGHAVAANIGWFPAGPQMVWAVHFNRGGTWSEPVSAAITINPPATPVVVAQKQGRTISLSWQD
ncbi:MAG: fibronectin type III domain-containing protein, partial [Comamonadaceae bacterium]